jgi:hypothetical protein
MLKQFLFRRGKPVAIIERREEGFELSLAEMRRGLILTKCPCCGDTRKHQTVNVLGQPFRPCYNTISRGGGITRYSRKCTVCGCVHEF